MAKPTQKIITPIVAAVCLLTLALYALGVFTDYPREVKSLSDPAGGSYSGWMLNGKYDGEGTLVLPGGDRYTGTFHAGLMDMHGQYSSVNNWIYEGGFADGKPSGSGTFTTAKGGVYKGAFRLGDITGEGTFSSVEGWSFTGTFKNGVFVKGKLTLKDGSGYDGPFKDGLADGQGVYIQKQDGKNIWSYEGAFQAGLRHGKGTMTTFGPGGSAVMEESGNWVQGVLK
ncbi:MAG: hypothetical protein LBT21_04780 [Oscillospiraceae bacterium]|jgi:hypothetical protein|nr:hypothetical protein [Oscillospiraceae bacterium]